MIPIPTIKRHVPIWVTRAIRCVVEKIGIDRSFQEVTSSDLILMVFDATADYTQDEIDVYQSIAQQYADKIIFVQNKIL